MYAFFVYIFVGVRVHTTTLEQLPLSVNAKFSLQYCTERPQCAGRLGHGLMWTELNSFQTNSLTRASLNIANS